MKIPMILPALTIAAALLACNSAREVNTTTAESGDPSSTSAPPVRASERSEGTTQLGGPEKKDSLFLTLERTPCFGTCKAYHIDLYRSGFAMYDGRGNMEKEGRHNARIGRDTLQLILAKAEALGFFAMKDVYDGEVTDLPSTHLRIVANGKDKKVMGRVGQPAAFKQLVADLESLLLPVPWRPVAAEP